MKSTSGMAEQSNMTSVVLLPVGRNITDIVGGGNIRNIISGVVERVLKIKDPTEI